MLLCPPVGIIAASSLRGDFGRSRFKGRCQKLTPVAGVIEGGLEKHIFKRISFTPRSGTPTQSALADCDVGLLVVVAAEPASGDDPDVGQRTAAKVSQRRRLRLPHLRFHKRRNERHRVKFHFKTMFHHAPRPHLVHDTSGLAAKCSVPGRLRERQDVARVSLNDLTKGDTFGK